MKPRLTLVYSYYDNPNMFKLQQHTWANYSKDIRDQVEIIVTDDCSNNFPAKDFVLNEMKTKRFRLFRIDEKIKWNWLECRNIGAKYAKSKWIILTDMDHLLTEKVIWKLLNRLDTLDDSKVYQFERVKAPDMSYYKHHNDTFLVTKKLFWKCGAYDEDYAGYYGTSGRFRRRLYRTAKAEATRLKDLSLVLYGREVIPDASTTEFKRKEGRKKGELGLVRTWKKNKGRDIQHFLRPYHEEVL